MGVLWTYFAFYVNVPELLQKVEIYMLEVNNNFK